MSETSFVYLLVCPTDLFGGKCWHAIKSYPNPLGLGHKVVLGVESRQTGAVYMVVDYIVKEITHRDDNPEWDPRKVVSTIVRLNIDESVVHDIEKAGLVLNARIIPIGFSPNSSESA